MTAKCSAVVHFLAWVAPKVQCCRQLRLSGPKVRCFRQVMASVALQSSAAVHFGLAAVKCNAVAHFLAWMARKCGAVVSFWLGWP